MKVKVQCDSCVDWAVKDSYVMFSINPLNCSLDDFVCEKHCVVLFQLLFTQVQNKSRMCLCRNGQVLQFTVIFLR